MKNYLLSYSPVFLLLACCSILFFSACKKPVSDGHAKLSFSESKISFDTIFTTLGSVTKNFKVYNTHDFPLSTHVVLAGGNYSFYSINVDGRSGIDFKEIEIPAKDSIFIHIKVTINPDHRDNPFLVTDSILFFTGSQVQDVDLLAYGQNANFFVANRKYQDKEYVSVAAAGEETVWGEDNGKPYVIFGWARVDSLAKLTIKEGTRVYFHKGAGLWVHPHGCLHVEGTAENPVLMRGDRLESWYEKDYAQWNGVWINEGNRDNILKHLTITQAKEGVKIEPLHQASSNETTFENCIIQNTMGTGLSAARSNLSVTNCQISNNGGGSVRLIAGNYLFRHVTIADYFGSFAKTGPAVYISNLSDKNETFNTTASFVNSIITGYAENELTVSQSDNASLDWTFENCIVKTTLNSHFVNSLPDDKTNVNMTIDFINYKEQDYRLKAEAKAIDAGKSTGIDIDLPGNPRDVNAPDIGAYEYSPDNAKFRKIAPYRY